MKKSPAKTKATKKAPSIILFYFEFCSSNSGVWDREWFLTRREANKARKDRAKDMGTDLEEIDEDSLCGDYGDIAEVEKEEVELTDVGLLAFARNFAVDNSN